MAELGDTAAVALERSLYELLRHRLVRSLPVANPAAGAEWAQAVPPGEVWELLSVRHRLATSAVVANRIPSLRLTDPNGVVVAQLSPQAVVAASGAATVDFLPGLGAQMAVVGQQSLLPTPPPVLPEGWSLGSLTTAIDVADQYSSVVIVYRAWSLVNIVQAAEWFGRKAVPT